MLQLEIDNYIYFLFFLTVAVVSKERPDFLGILNLKSNFCVYYLIYFFKSYLDIFVILHYFFLFKFLWILIRHNFGNPGFAQLEYSIKYPN